MTLAYVRWKDACTEHAEEPGLPILEDPLIELQEIGWLVAETSQSLSLAMELEVDGTPGRFRLHIPQQNILELRTMEFDKFPKRRRRL